MVSFGPSVRLCVVGFAALIASAAFADTAPDCYDRNGHVMAVDDGQVLQLKQSEPNGWRGRGNVDGTVIQVEPDHSGHNHFIVQIGPNAQTDIIEIIYNYDFGDLPAVQVGMEIQACGDFIESTAQNGPYPPSPAGAILHWVHVDPAHRHPDGFVMINGAVYGSDTTNAGHGPND
ncbi:MAG: DUF3465 domain-containing protein [Oligoflexia bacterium]|nr:DUF3465 domain-containing protein [Oligoflexia bacterium]